MSCGDCASKTRYTFVRVGKAEVGLAGCREHLRELIEVYRAGLDQLRPAFSDPEPVPADGPITTMAQLAVFCGGPASFTGEVLRLLARADPGMRSRLRYAFPELWTAWDAWMDCLSAPTPDELRAQISESRAAMAALPDDKEVVEQLAEWHRGEHEGTVEKATVAIGPFSAWITVAALQLAWRHPDMNELNRSVIRDLAGQLQVMFSGPPAKVLEMGWDTDYDQPPARSRSEGRQVPQE